MTSQNKLYWGGGGGGGGGGYWGGGGGGGGGVQLTSRYNSKLFMVGDCWWIIVNWIFKYIITHQYAPIFLKSIYISKIILLWFGDDM